MSNFIGQGGASMLTKALFKGTSAGVESCLINFISYSFHPKSIFKSPVTNDLSERKSNMKEAFLADLGYTYLLISRGKYMEDGLEAPQNAGVKDTYHKLFKENLFTVRDTSFWRKAPVEYSCGLSSPITPPKLFQKLCTDHLLLKDPSRMECVEFRRFQISGNYLTCESISRPDIIMTNEIEPIDQTIEVAKLWMIWQS